MPRPDLRIAPRRLSAGIAPWYFIRGTLIVRYGPTVGRGCLKRASESVPCPGLTKRTTIHCSYFLFVSARASGAARFEEPGLRGRAHKRWGSVSDVSDGRCTPHPRKLETEMEPD